MGPSCCKKVLSSRGQAGSSCGERVCMSGERAVGEHCLALRGPLSVHRAVSWAHLWRCLTPQLSEVQERGLSRRSTARDSDTQSWTHVCRGTRAQTWPSFLPSQHLSPCSQCEQWTFGLGRRRFQAFLLSCRLKSFIMNWISPIVTLFSSSLNVVIFLRLLESRNGLT